MDIIATLAKYWDNERDTYDFAAISRDYNIPIPNLPLDELEEYISEAIATKTLK